ncbi:MAG TPA: DUF1521 domain-containing protein [Pyrinomonadaceae bacterium]
MSHPTTLTNHFSRVGVDLAALSMNTNDAPLLALLEAATEFAGEFTQLTGGCPDASAARTCAPVSAPTVEDSCHPAGGLRVCGDTVTTPGGYTIEMLGQYEWKITGPDGKSTRIWGDPHVDEGDRDGNNDWEFKRNSTFVLGDGTRVNVTNVPVGDAGMTVTGQLEIISGNERVLVTSIDQGKGRVGVVTQDGFQHANCFRGDVFVMGREADDWSYVGREIIGSVGGGDSFRLGGELRALDARGYSEGMRWAAWLFENVRARWDESWRPNSYGCNPYWNSDRPIWKSDDPEAYDRQRHAEHLAEAFRALGLMFVATAAYLRMYERLSDTRLRHLLTV